MWDHIFSRIGGEPVVVSIYNSGVFLKSRVSTMLAVLLDLLTVKTVLIGVSCGLLAAWFLRTRRYKLPPGPMALPLIGNLLQCDTKTLHKQMFTWSEKYGPVISLNIGPKLIVVANDITTALEVLVKKSTDFAGRMKTPSLDALTNGGKDIAFGSYGPVWHIHRKLSSKALRMYMQGDNLDRLIHGALDVTLSEMDKIQGPFNPKDYINFLMGNILAGVCFGQVYSIENNEVNRLLELEDEAFKIFSGLVPEDLIPGLKYVYKSKTMKELDRVYDGIVIQYIKRKFEEEKATFDRDNIRHLTDFLLLAKLEAEQEEGKAAMDSFSDDYLIQTCSDIFLAGIDTSRLTITFAIRDIIIHPEIQEKVFAEINSVVGCNRLPQSSDRPQLAYTEAVLHESMRLNNPLPTGAAHVAMRDSTVNGYDVPKGTTVMINHWALHHRPDAWDQVDKFVPDRFLNADGKLGPKPTSWLPFSAGKRVCLGEFVAKPELHLLFAALVQRFKWKPEPGVIPTNEDVGTFFMAHPKPFKVVIEKRF